MSRAEVMVSVKATAAECFEFVDDHRNTPRFMVGIRSYDPLTKKARGKGARFLSVTVLAGKTIESEVECTTWVRHRKIVGTARSGPKIRGSWTFEEYDDGTTDVTLLNEYELPTVLRFIPGVGGVVERGMDQSLKKLKRLVEAETRKKKPATKK